jgi:hypothetical protein
MYMISLDRISNASPSKRKSKEGNVLSKPGAVLPSDKTYVLLLLLIKSTLILQYTGSTLIHDEVTDWRETLKWVHEGIEGWMYFV